MDIKVANSVDISANNYSTKSKLNRKRKKKHNNIETNDLVPSVFHKTPSDIEQSLIQVNEKKRKKKKSIDKYSSVYLSDSAQPNFLKSYPKKKNFNNDSVNQTSKKDLSTSSLLIERIRKSKLIELDSSDTEIDTYITKLKTNGMDNEVSHLLNIVQSKENTESKSKNLKEKKNKVKKINDTTLAQLCETRIENEAPKKKSREMDIKVAKTLEILPDNLNTILKLKRKKKKKQNNIETNDFSPSIFHQTPSDIDQCLIQEKKKKRKNIDKNQFVYLRNSEQSVFFKSYPKKKKLKNDSVNQISKKDLCTTSLLIERIRKSKPIELDSSDTENDTYITKLKTNGMDNEVSHLLNIVQSKKNTESKSKNLKEEKNKVKKINDTTLAQLCETRIENGAHKKKDKKRKKREMDIKVANSLEFLPDNSNTTSKLKRKKKKKQNSIETNDFSPSIFHQTPSDIDQSLIQEKKKKRKNIDKNPSVYLHDSGKPDFSECYPKKKECNNESVNQISSKNNLCTPSILVEKIRKSELTKLEISDTEIDTGTPESKNNGIDSEVSDLLNIIKSKENTVSKIKNSKEEENKNMIINNTTLAQICETRIENDDLQKKHKKKKLREMDVNVSNSIDISADSYNTISKFKRKKKKKHNNIDTNNFASSIFHKTPSDIDQSLNKKRKQNNNNTSIYLNVSTDNDSCLSTILKIKNKELNMASSLHQSPETNRLAGMERLEETKKTKSCINILKGENILLALEKNKSTANQNGIGESPNYMVKKLVKHLKEPKKNDINNLHGRSQSHENIVKCSYCSKEFFHNSHLNSHIKMHTGERPFKCDICDSAFTVKSSLTNHKRFHTGERPFKCDICDSAFIWKSQLTRHEEIHTGERPFQCDICDSAFIREIHLTNHKRIHTGERPYKCDICDSTFAQTSTLTIHKRIHTGERPYECDICGSAFAQKSSLTNHKRIHTGERPFKCDICGRAFTERSTLTSHKRIHTGERPYKCSICSRAFITSGHLSRHVNRVHNKSF